MIEFLIPEKDLPYDPKDKNSVEKYTKLLENRTLRDFTNITDDLENVKNKGLYGQKIENLFFFIKTNNHAGADFPDIPLELKTAGLVPTSSRDKHKNISGKWKAKEALPMSAISFNEIINEDFLSSKFLEKNENLLLIFYEFEKNKVIYDLKIRITGIWSFSEIPSYDKKIIIDDWELIKSKVMDGEAHNISRGDTEYLEAAPSATSDTFTSQPYGPKSRTRKFSFKSGYMHSVIAKLGSSNIQTESLYKEGDENISLSEKIYEKFKPYIGMSGDEIASMLGIENLDCKNAYSRVTNKLLNKIFNVPDGKQIGSYIEEFSKAEIKIKTIRLNSKNMPHEDVSLSSTLIFEEIIDEDWDNSRYKNFIDNKFLFIFFKESAKGFVLDKISYWNINNEDLKEAKRVWEIAKNRIENGQIINYFDSRNRAISFFPKSVDSYMAHVRTKGRDSKDTAKLPVKDKLTGTEDFPKHCFWFNKEYIRDNIYRINN
jgi:DNA mismatch repair protein MutH